MTDKTDAEALKLFNQLSPEMRNVVLNQMTRAIIEGDKSSDDIEMPDETVRAGFNLYPRESDKVRIACLRDVDEFVYSLDMKACVAMDLLSAMKALNFHCHFAETGQGEADNHGGIGLHGITEALYDKVSDINRDLDILSTELHRYREERRRVEQQKKDAEAAWAAHEAEREQSRTRGAIASNGETDAAETETDHPAQG